MTKRFLERSTFEIHPHLVALPLASPFRRLGAFVLDWIVLFIPTVVVSLLIAIASLSLTDPDALRGFHAIIRGGLDERERIDAMADIAPLLVRIDAQGLPAAVKLAVEESDYQKAGELLQPYDFDFSLVLKSSPPPLAPGHIRVDIQRFIPARIRGIAIFGMAALYFTLLTAGGRKGTLGKRMLGIRVVSLHGRPIGYWESFERFGGYLASVGTVGTGLLDFWRDPNRRLAHDRISNTVVVS